MKLGRHKGIEVRCEWCGSPFVALVQRVEQGLGKYCSTKCYNNWQRENKKSDRWGKENAKAYPKAEGGYFVQWYQENGKVKNSPWHIWAWEMNYGEIPAGHVVEYKDGDKDNITIENLQLRLTRRGKQALPKQKKVLSAEHRQKIGERTKQAWAIGLFDFHKTGRKSTKVERPKDRSEVMRKVHQEHPEIKKRVSEKLKGRIFTEEHKQHLRESNATPKGENSHWWKGGVSQNPYPEEFDRYLKQEIRSRDNHTCQSCGENVYRSKRGHVHHIDGNKQNCDKTNLILLCATCHNAVHGRNGISSPEIESLKLSLNTPQSVI